VVVVVVASPAALGEALVTPVVPGTPLVGVGAHR
jgi:hypothetical protein